MTSPFVTALIFDLDNTLIHSHIDFRALRHHLIDDLYAHAISTQSRDALMALSLPELVDLARSTDRALAEQMWATIGAAEVEGVRGADAVEGAVQVLGGLRVRGYKLALLTNNTREGVEERLAALDLVSHFDLIVTRTEGTALKPSPEGIHYILQRLPNIEAAYLIGDAYIDGRAAAAAGIRFIGFGDKATEIIARGISPWAWITDLRELLELAL